MIDVSIQRVLLEFLTHQQKALSEGEEGHAARSLFSLISMSPAHLQGSSHKPFGSVLAAFETKASDTALFSDPSLMPGHAG